MQRDFTGLERSLAVITDDAADSTYGRCVRHRVARSARPGGNRLGGVAKPGSLKTGRHPVGMRSARRAPWLAAAAVLWLGVMLPGSRASAGTVGSPVSNVYIDTDTTVVPDAMGFGVQWDPSDVWDYTPAQWQRTFARVDRLAPAFIRCMLGASSYCHLDASGALSYNWDWPGMQRLYPILDYCQKHDVYVMLGEWGAPFGWQWDDPRWSTAIGECLDHLVKVRGYTCIRYYNKINEPQGGSDIYRTWHTAQASLRTELVRRGLDRQIALVGPDASGREALQDWVDRAIAASSGLMGGYEVHWYASSATEIPNGDIETVLRGVRKNISARDPLGRGKPFFLGEAGTGEWLNGDSNRYIRDFVYGVYMADYAVQALRAGAAGMSAWMLDDSMHQQPGSFPEGSKPSGNPKIDFDFKVWGFWNTEGSAMGRPEDEQLRPWFTTWSLLSRCFPRGARILKVSDPHLPGLRVTAALIKRNDVSIAVVNDSQAPRTVTLKAPNATGHTTLAEYHYFEGDRSVDASGFPIVKQIRKDADLRAGLQINLPSQGVVILTSVDGGTPPSLGTGSRLPVSSVKIASANGLQDVEVGGALTLTAESEPGVSPTKWTVSDPTLATISPDGTLRGRRQGRVQAFATSAAGPTGVMEIEIRPAGLVIDTISNWARTSARDGAWWFESVHPGLFEGDTSRVKRGVDEPSSITWHYPYIRAFSARLYFDGTVEGKVRAYTSADGKAWSPLTLRHDAPTPTSDGWSRAVFEAVAVPTGANYVKLELRDDPVIWSPQLGEVRLRHGR